MFVRDCLVWGVLALTGTLWGWSAHDGRTVGYIALGGWWRVVDFRV